MRWRQSAARSSPALCSPTSASRRRRSPPILSELTQLTAKIEAERDTLRARYASLGEEQARIDLLVEAKQAQGEQTEAALTAEHDKAAGLAEPGWQPAVAHPIAGE